MGRNAMSNHVQAFALELSTLGAAVLVLSIILCFRARIDHWANSSFLVSPSQDSISTFLWFQRLEEENAMGRAKWVRFLTATCLITAVFVFREEIDLHMWLGMLTMIAVASATCLRDANTQYGGL